MSFIGMKSWKPSEQLYSVKQIAQAITPGGTDAQVAKTMRQIRHWTQYDLLRTETGKDTGTGVARLYAVDPTVMICAILKECSRYRTTVEVLRPLAKLFYDDWDTDQFFATDFHIGDMPQFVQIWWEEDEETGRITDADADIFYLEKDGSWANPDFALNREPASSILIHLTQVWGSIKLP